MQHNHTKGSLKRSWTEDTVTGASLTTTRRVADAELSSSLVPSSTASTRVGTRSNPSNVNILNGPSRQTTRNSDEGTIPPTLPIVTLASSLSHSSSPSSFSLPLSLCHMTPSTYLHTNDYVSLFTDVHTSGPYLYSLLQQENNILVNSSLYHHTLPLSSSSSSSPLPNPSSPFPRYKSVHTLDLTIFHPLRQSEITPRMRALLIDWLSNTCEQYLLRRYTFHRAVMILDRFLAKRHHLPRELFHCVGATCLHIAAKFEEIHYPSLNEIMEATNNKVTKPMMKSMELEICHCLEWNVQPPTVLHWLGNICQHIGIAADNTHTFVQSLQRQHLTSRNHTNTGTTNAPTVKTTIGTQSMDTSSDSLLPKLSAQDSSTLASPSTIHIMDYTLVSPELFVALLTCENGVDDEGYPVVQRYCMNVHQLPVHFPIEMPLHVIGKLTESISRSSSLSSSFSPFSTNHTSSSSILPSTTATITSSRIPPVQVPSQTVYSPHLPTKLFLDCATLADNCMMHIRSTAYLPSILSAAIVLVVLKQYEVDASLSIQEVNSGKYTIDELENVVSSYASSSSFASLPPHRKHNHILEKILKQPSENDSIFTGTSDAAVLLRLASLRSLVLDIIRQSVFRTLPMKNTVDTGTSSSSFSSSNRFCYVPIDPYTSIDNLITDRDYLWLLLEDACNWVYRMSMSMPNFHAHPYIVQALEAPEPALRVTKPELCLLQTSHEKMLNHVLDRLDEHKGHQEQYRKQTNHIHPFSLIASSARPPFTLQDGPIRSIMPELSNDWNNLGFQVSPVEKEAIILRYYQQSQGRLYDRLIDISSSVVVSNSDTLPSVKSSSSSVSIRTNNVSESMGTKASVTTESKSTTTILSTTGTTSLPTEKAKRSKTSASTGGTTAATIQIISNTLPLRKITQANSLSRSQSSSSTQRLITDSLIHSAASSNSSKSSLNLSNNLSQESTNPSQSDVPTSQSTNPSQNDLPSSQSSNSEQNNNSERTNSNHQQPFSSTTETTESSQNSHASIGSSNTNTDITTHSNTNSNNKITGASTTTKELSITTLKKVGPPSKRAVTTGLGTSSHRARQMAKLASHYPSSSSSAERIPQGTVETPSITVRENPFLQSDNHENRAPSVPSSTTTTTLSSVSVVVRRLAGSLY